jgi:hypothetical protein
LVFAGIDAAQQGEILAVVEQDGEFLLAVQPIGKNGVSSADKTVGLEFKFRSLEAALQAIAQ